MQNVILEDLGKVDYKETWDYQQGLLNQVVQTKRDNRTASKEGLALKDVEHFLILCEHKPVFTIGKSGSIDNLLLTTDELKKEGIDFYKINRGGDITFHGPGQLVAYPIFDLDHFFTDVHKYVRYLEEVVIRTLKDFDIEGVRMEGFTGVWLEKTPYLPKRKICAIGVHLSRWVTMHGLALNVQPDLKYFNKIIPCGINDNDKTVTSMEVELQKKLDMVEVKKVLANHFKTLFGFNFIQ